MDVALKPKLQTGCTYYDKFCFEDILGLLYGSKLLEGYALGLFHLNQKKVYMHVEDKRRGIGQFPIFSIEPYFYATKHTTVVLKVEI